MTERMEPLEVWKEAGVVPDPVAAITAVSAWCRSHSTVSPSDLWPSSRVSWKMRAAHAAGIRILRPLPSTLVCRSFVELLFDTMPAFPFPFPFTAVPWGGSLSISWLSSRFS